MDSKITDALAFANYRLTLQVQRQNIEARVQTALLLSYQSAIFKTTQELISFVDTKLRLGGNLFVQDQTNNVISILNPAEFLSCLITTYDSAMEMKQNEQHKLKSARSTAKIVGL